MEAPPPPPTSPTVRCTWSSYPEIGLGGGCFWVLLVATVCSAGDRPEVCGVGCAGRATCPPGKWVSSPVWPHFVIEELGAMRFLEMGTALGKRLPSCPVPVPPAPLPTSVCPQPPWARRPIFPPESLLVSRGQWRLRVLGRSGHSAFDLSLPGKSLRSHPQWLPSLRTFFLGLSHRVGWGVPTRLGTEQSCVDTNSS